MARKILLADDSVTAQNMGRKILADAGYDVVTVNNGSAALKKITEIKPDLIVLDVYMPGYSGLEVCQRLKDAAETAHIPVLLTVGKLEPFKAEEARRVRADEHIVKPFEASELLTAIARLEDRMVPQPSEGGRFSPTVSGVERFGGETMGKATASASDDGWRSRLRFPSKKKQEEPEPEAEDAAAGAAFRDFRKAPTKTKPGAMPAFTVKEPAPPGQEPGLVPDAPHDITPAELDALSALAAKLDGPMPAREEVKPLGERTGPGEDPTAELLAVKTAIVKTEVEVPAAGVEAKKEREEEKTVRVPALQPDENLGMGSGRGWNDGESSPRSDAPLETEQRKPDFTATAVSAEAPASPVEALAPAPANEGERESESTVERVPAALEAVNAAFLAQEPAPVDRNDEPLFATAASAMGQAVEEPAVQEQEKTEAKPAEAAAPIEGSALAEAVPRPGAESKPEASKAEELKAEKIAQPVPLVTSVLEANVPEVAEPEGPGPSDEELAEALRMLTPATVRVDDSTIPSHGTLMAAGQLLAEEAARNAAAGPRWIAEPVALSPEEAAISLEAEMFRTFAAVPAEMSAAASGSELELARPAGVTAIAAAVENRLEEAGLAATSSSLAETGVEQASGEPCSGEQSGETGAEETSAANAPADAIAAVPSAASASVAGIVSEKSEVEKKVEEEVEKLEAEAKDSSVKVAEEEPAEAAVAATFADALSRDEVEAADQNQQSVGTMAAEEAAAAIAAAITALATEENCNSISEVGGRESMGNEKAKAGKSNWHQIRTAPAGAATKTDVVEAAKQAEAVAEEAPKVMAAAAAAEASAPASASTSTSVPDASTIASIVDSVMADLRPRIVEEIARKLAGK